MPPSDQRDRVRCAPLGQKPCCGDPHQELDVESGYQQARPGISRRGDEPDRYQYQRNNDKRLAQAPVENGQGKHQVEKHLGS